MKANLDNLKALYKALVTFPKKIMTFRNTMQFLMGKHPINKQREQDREKEKADQKAKELDKE